MSHPSFFLNLFNCYHFNFLSLFQMSSKIKEALKEAREKAETRLTEHHRKVKQTFIGIIQDIKNLSTLSNF